MIHCKLQYRLKMSEPLNAFSMRSQRVCVLNLGHANALVKLINRSHFKTFCIIIGLNKADFFVTFAFASPFRLCISENKRSPKINSLLKKNYKLKSRAILYPVRAVCPEIRQRSWRLSLSLLWQRNFSRVKCGLQNLRTTTRIQIYSYR